MARVKEYKLHVLMMEITDRAIQQQILFSEVLHVSSNTNAQNEIRALEFNLKSLALTLIYQKKTHSFLRTLKDKTWDIELCLVDTKIFPSAPAMDKYIKNNKIKNGPLFKIVYNNFFPSDS